MVISRDTSDRRKSIAVAQPSDAVIPKRRRRATSFAPGDESPRSRSKRISLGPIRGILKRRSSSQPPDARISSASQEDGIASMDLTTDYQEHIRDNFTRKSLSRRVSFSTHSDVREFKSKRVYQESSGSYPSQDLPDMPSSDDFPPVVNDENAYPGSTRSRRSSMRPSFAGTEDMDLTSTSLFAHGDEAAIADEEFDFEPQESDMDVTEAYSSNLKGKRSLSTGGSVQRPPLSQISDNPTPTSDAPEDLSQSFLSDQSMLSDQAEPRRFTIPLGQPLRPAHEDETWLQLVAGTHAGVATVEGSDSEDAIKDMDVDDAIARVVRARQSLNLAQREEGSMVMSEDSFENSFDPGDDTVDISRMMGKGFNSRDSRAFQPSDDDMDMDESEIYGEDHGLISSTPRPSLAAAGGDLPDFMPDPPTPQAKPTEPTRSPPPTVFSLPPSEVEHNAGPSTSNSKALVSPTKGSKSPSKTPTKGFTAAFAPPVSKPSPKKPSTPVDNASSLKRPRISTDVSHADEAGKPSPAKRQALASRWSQAASPETAQSPPPTSPNQEPRPLDPSKKAPFQAAPPTEKPNSKPNSLRRPSGYLARRKSLAVGFGATPATAENAPSVTRTSPKKKASIGLGRASMGSAASSDAWKRFDRNAEPVQVDFGKGREKGKDILPQAEKLVQSSKPNLLPPFSVQQPQNVDMVQDPGPSSPSVPVVDLSTFLDSEHLEDEDDHVDVDMAAATEQWRDAIPADGYSADEGPPISIEQFFVMTDIKFMDELTAPRRSMHPSQQAQRQPRNPDEIGLAEYAVASSIDTPQLALYTRVANDLEGWMKQSKTNFEQCEEEAGRMTPQLFTEFSSAGEKEQEELKQHLKLIRTNTRGHAKSDWYDYKLKWIDTLRIPAEKYFTELQNDAKALANVKAKCDEALPSLEQEYEQVMRELEKEQAEVAAIEECDQNYLTELKNSITDQNHEIDALRNEEKEGLDQLVWLKERLADIEAHKREATTAINEASRLLDLQKNGTRSEVFRLKEELETLEDLHMFRITKVNANIFEYVYASAYRVSIPCQKYQPVVEKIDIVPVPESSRHKDDFPRLKNFLLSAAKHMIRNSGESTTRRIVQKLSDYWSSCSQLCLQFRLLSLRYPLEIELNQSSAKPFSEFRAQIPLLFPSRKSKVIVSFVFNRDAYSRWPVSIKSMRYEVAVAYGSARAEDVSNALQKRLSEASPQGNYACLLDACIIAQEC
ncbi:hypothetical protein D9758_000082 [Tetrapyrgos nigripes]|uniref:Spc7 kinetochore protein domain-containing protein n=1 Tax=Tetrapyrgos nigripes TaxID=182062 RepID=A0A8H5H1K8_9AGAR|nr:hypothetical protein D9758_000082 [Tetrapyrgos nigripes]